MYKSRIFALLAWTTILISCGSDESPMEEDQQKVTFTIDGTEYVGTDIFGEVFNWVGGETRSMEVSTTNPTGDRLSVVLRNNGDIPAPDCMETIDYFFEPEDQSCEEFNGEEVCQEGFLRLFPADQSTFFASYDLGKVTIITCDNTQKRVSGSFEGKLRRPIFNMPDDTIFINGTFENVEFEVF